MILKPRLFRKPRRKGHWASKGLVGFWLFNEGSGNKVFDLSGNGNDGPIGVGTVWSAGKFGSALYYGGGLTHEVKFTQNVYDLLGIRRTATFLTWVRVDSAIIHHACVSDYTSSKGFSLKITSGNKAEFYVYPNNHRVTGTVNVGANIWVQLVGVMDGANIYLYKDGVLVGTDTLGEDIGDSTGVLQFGQRGDGSDEMAGFQDHVIIWNCALSASEIALLYRESFCMFERDPIELWSAATLGVAPPAGIPILRRRREAC